MSTARAGWLGALIVIVAAGLFGSLGVTSRTAYDAGMQPFAFVAWRAGVGALGITVLLGALRGRARGDEDVSIRHRSTAAGLALAVVLGAGVNLAMFLAFDRTTVALALLGFYTYPAMVAAGSALLGRERLDGWRLVALGLAVAGMVAVVLGGLGSTAAVRVDPLGIALGLAAGAFQTAFILTSRRFAGVPAERAMGVILLGSAAVAAVVSVVAAGGPSALLLPFSSGSLLLLLVGVGLFAAAVPSTLFLLGIRWVGPVRTGILMLFEPVVGVVLAAMLLAEPLTPVQIAGGVTILAAAVLVQRGSAAQIPATSAVAPAPGGP